MDVPVDHALKKDVLRLSADSSVRMLPVGSRDGATRDTLPSDYFDDAPDRCHNDLWLLDRDDVT